MDILESVLRNISFFSRFYGLLLLAMITDIVTTVYALSLPGFSELNPVVLYLLQYPLIFILIKILIAMISATVLTYQRDLITPDFLPVFNTLCVGLVIFMFIPGIYNILQIGDLL